jgi:hypothetical protein
MTFARSLGFPKLQQSKDKVVLDVLVLVIAIVSTAQLSLINI